MRNQFPLPRQEYSTALVQVTPEQRTEASKGSGLIMLRWCRTFFAFGLKLWFASKLSGQIEERNLAVE